MNHLKDKVICAIKDMMVHKTNLIVAIDGRCASGKTSFANELHDIFDCNIVHMDDFFLPVNLRTKDRLEIPGGNFDKERFISEIIAPLKKGEILSYRPFRCKTQDYGDDIFLNPNKMTVIEGAYSCHPDLFDCYDITVFMSVDERLQLERIINRSGKEQSEAFKSMWIPMEERYFQAFDIINKCTIKK